ncbi:MULTISPECIES: WPE palindromic element domain-containing protein [unclassified Wolbachia]|nr:WPE palindromic element domain-containing protein [Wolbachia endosymbiont (group A) of Ectemnius continuus]
MQVTTRLSLQCLFMSFQRLFMSSQCLGIQLYECCDIRAIFTEKDVIPVLDYLDPENLTVNERTRQLYNKNWIPVSSTGITPPATQTSVDYKESSYSCRSSHRVTKKGYWYTKRGTL